MSNKKDNFIMLEHSVDSIKNVVGQKINLKKEETRSSKISGQLRSSQKVFRNIPNSKRELKFVRNNNNMYNILTSSVKTDDKIFNASTFNNTTSGASNNLGLVEHKKIMFRDRRCSSFTLDNKDTCNEKYVLKTSKFESILDIRRKYRKFGTDMVSNFKIYDNKRYCSQPNLSYVKNSLSNFNFDSIMAEVIQQVEERKIIKNNFKKFLYVYKKNKNITSAETNLRSKSLQDCCMSYGKRKCYSESGITKETFELFRNKQSSVESISIGSSLSEKSISVESCSSEENTFVGRLKKSNSKLSKKILNNIEALSLKINTLGDSNGLTGFLLCRRGALYRKIGYLSDSYEDLNRAEKLEPRLLDIYWQRHLLFLVQGDAEKALNDLYQVTLCNKNHTYAHWSRALIYKDQGKILQAISSLNQAILSNSFIANLYSERAELHEQNNDLIMALDDYKKAHNLLPNDFSAMLKVAVCHFNLRLWVTALSYFTELLNLNPKYYQAYFYRARVNIKLNHFENALSDLSICLHLSPNHYEAFYYRGFILQKNSRKQAIKDLSVSLLINSNKENINAFIQRGIVYTILKKFQQALVDLKCALVLNSEYPLVHFNLGLIDINYNNNAPLALKRFSFALLQDPTYIQALICRAETFILLNNIDAAIIDYTRAIHLNPLSKSFKIARGYLLLKKQQYDQAIFHIKQCAMINFVDKTTYEQVVMEIFFKNFDAANNQLETNLANNHDVKLLSLLGKSKMREKEFLQALETFKSVLFKLTESNLNCSKESSLIHLNIALCHIQLNDYKKALISLNNALKADNKFFKVHYLLGIVKMKLRFNSPIVDFNHCLALNSLFYQAYFGYALHYGSNKQYTKAILSCNKALLIEAQSIAVLIYRGCLKLHIKAYSLAIKDLSEAIKLNSSCYLAFYNRAVCFHAKKFYFAALKDYSIVVLSNCEYSQKAFLNRGVVYFEINDFQNALLDFVALLEHTPKDPIVLYNIGLCYHRLGDHKESKRFYTRALEVDSLYWLSLIGRANVLMECNNTEAYKSAQNDYSRALFINPNCLQARLNLARCLQVKNKHMKAWYLFSRALEIDPNCICALEGRALVSLQLNNRFEALCDLNNAIKLKKSPELLTNRGVVNMVSRDNVNAMYDYKMAIQLNQSFETAYFNAANICFLNHQFSQALLYYDNVIKCNQKDEVAFISRGVCKIVLNRNEEALHDINQAISINPYLSYAYYNRGMFFELIGKLKESESDYSKALELQPGDALIYKRRSVVRGKLGESVSSVKDFHEALILQTSKK
ncbi:uncharacterized protein LOC101237560 isoform X1 [Hydra vulgaris]